MIQEEALARAHEKRVQEKRAAASAGAGGAGASDAGAGAGAGGAGAGADMAEALRRYAELSESTPWRHDLGQRIADFHLGLLTHIGNPSRALPPAFVRVFPFFTDFGATYKFHYLKVIYCYKT